MQFAPHPLAQPRRQLRAELERDAGDRNQRNDVRCADTRVHAGMAAQIDPFDSTLDGAERRFDNCVWRPAKVMTERL